MAKKQAKASSKRGGQGNQSQGNPGQGKSNAADISQGQKSSEDAIALLKADHRKVEELFARFKSAADEEKSDIIRQVCNELSIHATLEEEIFYPACREKDVDDALLDEAQVEHDTAKVLVADLMEGSPGDECRDAKVAVLAEYIRHHVAEEEKGGDSIFAKAREAGVDLQALGTRIQQRKTELTEQANAGSFVAPIPRSLNLRTTWTVEEYNMAQQRYDQDRDEQGRFTGENRGRGGRQSQGSDRYDRGASQGYGQNYGRDRDEQGRFMREDERGGRSSWDRDREDQGGRYSGYQGGGYQGGGYQGSQDRERDEQGRFMSEDRGGRGRQSSNYDYEDRGRDRSEEYRGRQGGYSSRGQDQERDEQGRFTGEYSRGDERYGSRSDYGDQRRYGREDDRGESRRQSSFESGRDRDEYGRFTSDDDQRFSSGGNRSRGRDEDEDRDRNRSRSSGGGSGGGHGGWFGDSRGHSEAARQGWRNRQ